MAQLKGVLFDMDGTLVDNLAYHFASFDEFIKRKGLTLLEPVSLRINGMHSDDVFRILLGEEECKKHSLDALNREKEEVYEPFLIKEGFLKRTPRGREVTELAYKHLGLTQPEREGELF